MKKLAMIGISLFFASIFFLLFGIDREGIKEMKVKSDSSFEGLTILQKKDGALVWTLTARKADIKEDENIAKLTDITLVLQKNGMVLYTDRGTYDLTSRDFTAESEIRGKAKDYTIKVDSIDYEDISGEFKTEGQVHVEGKKLRVDGKGMMVDAEQKVRILKDVKATFHK